VACLCISAAFVAVAAGVSRTLPRHAPGAEAPTAGAG
jgi:hypothetical protein